jgi:hypothetical protein
MFLQREQNCFTLAGAKFAKAIVLRRGEVAYFCPII